MREIMWEKFTYRVKLESFYPIFVMKYVTKVDFEKKTFEMDTLDNIKKEGKEIQTFSLERAVDLMNSMYCNGYVAAIEPYFKPEEEEDGECINCDDDG